ncbi:hypothetical protein [Sulfurimicrobium lacus]|uniref:hypothetical protein n=1 Tax=Sulfurimicrobium lacus TaxID=2715678 RepID=UPI001563B067|nr:hypothetical protein [Sulfurimicrobium lacus]
MPEWGARLRNYYWMLRYHRAYDYAARRCYYRKIEAEKKRLIESGVHQEEVRLYCRSLANLRNNAARMRFESFSKQLRLF